MVVSVAQGLGCAQEAVELAAHRPAVAAAVAAAATAGRAASTGERTRPSIERRPPVTAVPRKWSSRGRSGWRGARATPAFFAHHSVAELAHVFDLREAFDQTRSTSESGSSADARPTCPSLGCPGPRLAGSRSPCPPLPRPRDGPLRGEARRRARALLGARWQPPWRSRGSVGCGADPLVPHKADPRRAVRLRAGAPFASRRRRCPASSVRASDSF